MTAFDRFALSGLLLIASLVFGVSCSGAGRPDALSPTLEARLDRRIRELVGLGYSGQVLVAQGNRVILHRGYGWSDPQGRQPVTQRTGYYVASITKNFTAAAILKLRDMGKLRLTDTLGRFFPEAPPDKRAITLDQLLAHTSGIVKNYAADGITDRGAAVQAIFAQPLGTPGEFHYTNDSYVLLGAIVEVASGESLETFFSEQLFQPAGLRDSGFWGFVDIDDATRFAHIRSSVPEHRRRANWGDRAASGVISTAGDLYRWWQAVQTDRVLPRQSVQDLFAPRVGSEGGTRIAAGWYWTTTARGTRALWTRGTEDFGHNALLQSWIDEGFILAMTTNAGDIEGQGWNKRMPAEIEAILWPGNAPSSNDRATGPARR